MFPIPLAYSNMQFLLTYSVARSHSWDCDVREFQCSWYYARLPSSTTPTSIGFTSLCTIAKSILPVMPHDD